MILEKHSRLPRKYTPGKAPRATKPGIAVAPELKAKILEDAKVQIMAGHTLVSIAEKHGIAERTLEYWLAAMGEEYKELREAWIDNMLAEARELLKNPGEDDKAPLRLAKARELWKSATWYAERRDRNRYGQEQAQSVLITPILNITLSPEQAQEAALALAPRAHALINVHPQQYDSGAAQQEVITDAVPVDNTSK